MTFNFFPWFSPYIYIFRCYERLKPKTEGSKILTHAGLTGGKGDLRIGTRGKDERIESERGECVI